MKKITAKIGEGGSLFTPHMDNNPIIYNKMKKAENDVSRRETRHDVTQADVTEDEDFNN